MNIHNIGGLRRFHRWETADIAIIVFVYQAGNLLAQKLGLLQSKRLYPSNHDVDDGDPIDFAYGMNKFLRRDPNWCCPDFIGNSTSITIASTVI